MQKDFINNDEIHNQLIVSQLHGQFSYLREKNIEYGGLKNILSKNEYYYYGLGEKRIERKLNSVITSQKFISKKDGLPFKSNVSLGELEIEDVKIIGKASADLYSMVKTEREACDYETKFKNIEKSTIGLGIFKIHEKQFIESEVHGKYHEYDAIIDISYDVHLEGKAQSLLDSSLEKVKIDDNTPLATQKTDQEFKFGAKDLKLTPESKEHVVTTNFIGINKNPIYEESQTESYKGPKIWEKRTRRYYHIIDKFEWTEKFEFKNPFDPVRAIDANKFKIKFIEKLTVPNDSSSLRIKYGVEIRQIKNHYVDIKEGPLYSTVREIEEFKEKQTKFNETSEIAKRITYNGDIPELNLKSKHFYENPFQFYSEKLTKQYQKDQQKNLIPYESNLNLDHFEIKEQKIIGIPIVDIYSMIKNEKENLNYEKNVKNLESSTVGFGKFKVQEIQFSAFKVPNKYLGYKTMLNSSYEVYLKGEVLSTLSDASEKFEINEKIHKSPEKVEQNYKFGEKNLKFKSEIKSHHALNIYYMPNDNPIYETETEEWYEGPELQHKRTYQYYQIIENSTWTEKIESADFIDAIRTTDKSKYKIKSLEDLYIPIDSITTRTKYGVEVRQINSYNVEITGNVFGAFRETKMFVEKHVKFNETSQIGKEISSNGYSSESNLVRLYDDTPFKVYNKEITIESYGWFLNVKTEKNSDKIFGETIYETRLNQASLGAISSFSAGLTTIALNKKLNKSVGIYECGKITLNTLRSFLIGHVSKVMELKKNTKAAETTFITAFVIIMAILTFLLCFFDKNDRRRKREKFLITLIEAVFSFYFFFSLVNFPGFMTVNSFFVALDSTISLINTITILRKNNLDQNMTIIAMIETAITSILIALVTSKFTNLFLTFIFTNSISTKINSMVLSVLPYPYAFPVIDMIPYIISGIIAVLTAFSVQIMLKWFYEKLFSRRNMIKNGSRMHS